MDEIFFGLLALLVALVVFFGGLGGLISIFWLGSVNRRVSELEIHVRKIAKLLAGKPQPAERESDMKPREDLWKPIPPAEPAPAWKPTPAPVPEPVSFTLAEPVIEPGDEAKAEPERIMASTPEPAAFSEKTAVEGVSTGETGEPKILDFETQVGEVWFNRIGLVALIIAFALMGRYITPLLQPWHKTALSYLASAALLIIGWRFEERLRIFARPVMAGGAALAFFSSYAAYFLPAMACVPLGASLALMSASIGGLFLLAERWQSESTAGLAIFLGHVAAYTAGGNADAFTLIAIMFLDTAAVFLLWRHSWVPLSLFAVCASYLSHLLWSLQDHPMTSPEFSFWLNFSFLSSYYVLFLAADLLYHARLRDLGRVAFTLPQRSAGRALGAVSLVFYSILVTGLFLGTKIYWDHIFLFFLPLAGLQVVLMLYHEARDNPDHPWYAATATLFLNLGLFSWLGGLTLNLVLAAQALLLLVMSRSLRFWFLNPLAQVVIFLNFVHYWTAGAHHFSTVPAYLGGLATALVYFTQARLEETWEFMNPDESGTTSKWVKGFLDTIQAYVKPLAFLHAGAGALLMTAATYRYFDAVPVTIWFMMGFSLLSVVVAAWMKSAALNTAPLVFITAGHWWLYDGLTPGTGVREHPAMTFCLVLVTLGFGVLVEWFTPEDNRKADRVLTSGWGWGFGYFYVLAFVLAGIWFWIRGDMLFESGAMIYPFWMIFPLAALSLGWGLNLGCLQIAAYAASLAWLLPEGFATPLEYSGSSMGLLTAGLIVFIQYIGMERMLAVQDSRILDVIQKNLGSWMRRLLVAAAGAWMLFVLSYSEVLRGYWTSVGWTLLALSLLVLGFVWKGKSYRRVAMAVFVLAIGRVFLIDVAQLETFYRMVAFMCLGITLILVSFLYARMRRQIREWL
ncbi:MAG: DUF2339 domain-containing protein [bacterium]